MKKQILIKTLFFIFVYITLSSILTYYFYIDKNERIKIYLSQSIKKLYSEYRATKNSYKMLANFFYDEIKIDKTFLQVLAKASHEKKAKLELYKILQPKFSILQKYSINYLAIDDPTGNTVVAMHKKIKSRKIKKNIFIKQPSPSNELLIEFRKPLYFNHTLIGQYKCAISYNVLRLQLQQLFKGQYAYIINENLINNKIFRYGNYLFVQSDLQPHFYYEQNSQNSINVQEKELIHAINLKIKNKIAQMLMKFTSFAVYTKLNNKYYIATFLLIKSKQPIGYLISYKPDNNIAIFQTTFWQNTLFSHIIIIIILIFIYYVLETKNKFERMAVTDKLTGLYNRYKFYLVTSQEINRAKRTGRPFSVILFDIDDFKTINDRYGHDVGDYVLRTIAKILRKNLRTYDYIFRWGGEEFIVLAPETDAQKAMQLAEKIRKLIEQYQFQGIPKITISLGVAQFDPTTESNIDATIKRADNALYISKKEGKNKASLAV